MERGVLTTDIILVSASVPADVQNHYSLYKQTYYWYNNDNNNDNNDDDKHVSLRGSPRHCATPQQQPREVFLSYTTL